MSMLAGVLSGGQSLTWHVFHQTSIQVERRYDGSGECKTVACVKSRVREFLAWSGWNAAKKRDARQVLAAMDKARITDSDWSVG